MVKERKSKKPSPSHGALGARAGNTTQPVRNRARRWCFTFNNYDQIGIDQLNRFITSDCDRAVYGHETAPTTGTAHLQGYLECTHERHFTAMKSIDHRIRWEKAKGSASQNYTYCTKGTDIFTHGDWSDDIDEELRDELKDKELRPWQQELMDRLQTKADCRKIIWFSDPKGLAGKSSFKRHWLIKHPNDIETDGNAQDIKFQLACLQKAGRKIKDMPKVIIFDFPRCKDLNLVSYSGMEAIKMGCFASPKYESTCVLMNYPHVVVFANGEPIYSKCTADRWDVIHLSKGEPFFNNPTLLRP